MPASDNPLILVSVEERDASGRVARVTVNNPDRRNALGMSGKQQLAKALRGIRFSGWRS
jgi:enoyl-CoA hydratase/carnithine racemase